MRGNDTYFVDSTGDQTIEAASAGLDFVRSTISWTLGNNVEELQLLGTAPLNGTGNTLNNWMQGNSAGNVLDGLGGNDTLITGGGADVVRFTTALGVGNIDRINDFSVADDTIQLANAVFTSLVSTGALASGSFVSGVGAAAVAVEADDYILYDTATGALYYDADADGIGGAVQFATLIGFPGLLDSDFLVI